MTTNIMITPTFNDWQSLSRLINKINTISKKVKGTFKIIIINDVLCMTWPIVQVPHCNYK